MKFKLVNGVLVPATDEDIKNGVEVFELEDPNLSDVDKDTKTEENSSTSTPGQAPAVHLSNSIAELTGLIKEMAEERSTASNASDMIKEEKEKLEAQIASYKEMQKRGLILPGASVDDANAALAQQGNKGGIKQNFDILNPYNLSIQGKELCDKHLRGSSYAMPEEKREDFAAMMVYFLKGWLGNDPMVKHDYSNFVKYIDRKYNVKAESSTALGQTANDFPVPTPLEAEILMFAREASVILKYCRVWPMTSETKTIPTENSGVTVSWGRTTTESNPDEFDFVLTNYVLSAFSTVNQELLEDTISDVVSWIAGSMAEAIGLELDNVAFNGDGTSTYAGCSGLLTAHCGYSVVMASGDTDFSDLNDTYFSQMIAKLDGRKKEGSRFFMHGEVLHYMRQIKDDNGIPIFYPGYVGRDDPPTIFGYPYVEVIKAPSTSAANTAFMAFGNMKHFAVGRRIANMRLSVDPYGKWEENQVRYKIRNRWGLGMSLPKGFVRLLTASN